MPVNSIKKVKTKEISDKESLKRLYKVSAKLSSSLDLDETLKAVAKGLLEITNYEFCNIYLTDHKDPRFFVNKYGSDTEKYFLGERIEISKSTHLKKIFTIKEPLYYCGLDKRGYLKPSLLKFLKKHNITCTIYIPLRSKDSLAGHTTQGCIILDRNASNCDIVSGMLNKNIMTLVNQAATVIDNCIMYNGILNQRDRWYSIYEDSSDGIAIVDDDMKIRGINSSLASILEISPRTVDEKEVGLLFHEDEVKKIWGEISFGFQEGLPKLEGRDVLLKANGKYIWVNMRVSFVKSSRDYTRAILSFTNITKEKELEQSKNDFISIVSHELRNPVTLIKGFLSLALKKEYGELSEKQNNFLYRALDSSDRMANLLEHILDVNRIVVGKVELQLEKVDMMKIFSLARKDLALNMEAKKIKINIRRGGLKKAMALADKERLYQIMYNLFDNAIKYSHHGDTIRVGFRENNSRITFSLTDTGVGISSGEKKKLFEKFSRVNNPLSMHAGGFGLGLYIVKNLVKAHGGDIKVTSEENKGTTFEVILEKA